MGSSDKNVAEDEIQRLRNALDAETRACLDVQRKLDRAAADFEEFVSVAAHNLRESLREVASFSGLLAESHAGFDAEGGRFGPEAGAFLARIQEGAARMQSLLTDVVDYWAAGSSERRPTDMEAVLRQALLFAEKQIVERAAVVSHDPLPRVCGDSTMLGKVLSHLIRNAIEYCGTAPARVHISSRRVGPDWVFSVQDNGPGIEPAFQGRIFLAFKRLHGKECPGNGLGLAFCKKTIEWHDGRIWMESTPGAGSTFYFTLPPAD